jgi:hypothetical protein
MLHGGSVFRKRSATIFLRYKSTRGGPKASKRNRLANARKLQASVITLGQALRRSAPLKALSTLALDGSGTSSRRMYLRLLRKLAELDYEPKQRALNGQAGAPA